MPAYQVLVTDITNFGDLRCVAGWDLDRSKMIRPEPSPGGFWPASKIAPNGPFGLGKVAKFVATEPSRATDYPHRTEDRVESNAYPDFHHQYRKGSPANLASYDRGYRARLASPDY